MLALCMAAGLALSCTACGSTDVGASAAMFLRKTEGTVGVTDAEGTDIAFEENLSLYKGYTIRTEAGSCAWIDLDETKRIELDEKSTVEITKNGKNLSLNLIYGSLFFNMTEPLADDETMEICTDSMRVDIHGTCGWVYRRYQNVAGMLEGSLTVTAGNKTETVNAGEKVWLPSDYIPVVTGFFRDNVPDFVVRAILEDDALRQALQDTIGLVFPMSYEELLSILEKEDPEEEIVYSELIDFETDGSPELLVIRQYETFGDPGWPDKRLYFRIYRNGPAGVRPLTRSFPEIAAGLSYMSCSLVERDGRLFVECRSEGPDPDNGNASQSYVKYSGSIAGHDGVPEEWGVTDYFHCKVDAQGNHSMEAAGHRENGFIFGTETRSLIGGQDALLDQYTFVRELYRIDFTH